MLSARHKASTTRVDGKLPLLVVLYANPDYYPPTINAVRLLRDYFSLHILCRNMEKPVEHWPPDVAIERVGQYASERDKERARPPGKVLEYARFVLAVRKRILALKPSVLYAYDPHALAAVFLGSSQPALPCPIVYHCHEQPDMNGLRFHSLQSWIIRYAVPKGRATALVVFPEKYRAQYYMNWANDPRHPIIVPNCPMLDFLPRPADFVRLIESRWNEKEILHTGVIGPGSALLETVHALVLLAQKHTFRLFGIVRDQKYSDRVLQRASALGIEGKVVIEGWLPPEKFVAGTMGASVGLVLYEPGDINRECVGPAANKLFQYGARGIPAIVADNRSFREFLSGETWIAYADPTSPESIAAALRQIFADQDRYAAMCHAARRAFEEKYNYEHVFAPVLDRIIELTGANSALGV